MSRQAARFPRLRALGLLLAAACIVALGVGRVTNWASGTLLRSVEVRSGVIERTHVGDGVLVLSEQTVRAPIDGRLTWLVGDQQRVRAGQIVAELHEVVDGRIAAAQADLDAQIAALDREATASAADFQRNLQEVQRQLAAFEQQMQDALAAGRDDLARDFNQSLALLRSEYRTTQEAFDYLRTQKEVERAALVDRRRALLDGVEGERALVRAAAPGVVHFAYDGFETLLAPGAAPDAVWGELAGAGVFRRVADQAVVRAGDPLFRLIDNFQAHIFVRFQSPVDLRQGQGVWLRWPGIDEPGLRGQVHSVHNRLEQTGVWFSLSVYQPQFSDMRMLGPVTVVTQRYQGVVVPVRALSYRDDRPGLYLMVDRSPIFRYVNVLGGNDEYVVVDRVPSGTRVVINPQRMARR